MSYDHFLARNGSKSTIITQNQKTGDYTVLLVAC